MYIYPHIIKNLIDEEEWSDLCFCGFTLGEGILVPTGDDGW
jgi:hypothetical protein